MHSFTSLLKWEQSIGSTLTYTDCALNMEPELWGDDYDWCNWNSDYHLNECQGCKRAQPRWGWRQWIYCTQHTHISTRSEGVATYRNEFPSGRVSVRQELGKSYYTKREEMGFWRKCLNKKWVFFLFSSILQFRASVVLHDFGSWPNCWRTKHVYLLLIHKYTEAPNMSPWRMWL